MIGKSFNVRNLILVISITVLASYSFASPISIPPMPPLKPGVTMAASPISIPPMPPLKPGVTMAASPISIPPMPPLKPGVTA